MRNVKKGAITSLFETIKGREEVRLLIPMGYVPGMPIITIKNEQLVAIVPFLRYKVTGKVDRTLVFPIKYVLEYLIPEAQVVSFRDLSIEKNYANRNFDEVLGFFRHEAIKNLDKRKYTLFKKEILAQYDKLVNFLLCESELFTLNDETALKNNLQTIIEPFILNLYAELDIDFYNKYLQK